VLVLGFSSRTSVSSVAIIYGLPDKDAGNRARAAEGVGEAECFLHLALARPRI
jgi:hypothetical protein